MIVHTHGHKAAELPANRLSGKAKQALTSQAHRALKLATNAQAVRVAAMLSASKCKCRVKGSLVLVTSSKAAIPEALKQFIV